MAHRSTMLTRQIVENVPNPAPGPSAGSKHVAPQRGVPESVDESQESRPHLDHYDIVVVNFAKKINPEKHRGIPVEVAHLALAEGDTTDLPPPCWVRTLLL